jgi:tetratricopeptide (TPR) repeat protein
MEAIGSDVGRWIRLLGNKAKYYFNSYEVPNNRNIYFSKRFAWILQQPLVTFGFVLPFALLGMFVVRRNFKNHAPLFFFFIAHFTALLLFFVNARYRLIVVPVLLVYSGAALAWIFEKLRKKAWLKLGVAGVSLLLIFSFVYVKVPPFSLRANYTSLGNAYRKFGEHEKALENYDKAIAASRSYYYAYFRKAQLLDILNRNAEAENVYQQALSLAKKDNNTVYVRRIGSKLRQLQKKTP